jgi:hypothetical protein
MRLASVYIGVFSLLLDFSSTYNFFFFLLMLKSTFHLLTVKNIFYGRERKARWQLSNERQERQKCCDLLFFPTFSYVARAILVNG